MEKIAYILLLIVALCWLLAMFVGMVAAFPMGLIGLVGIAGLGLLFIKVITRQSIVLSRHAALRAAYSGRFLLFDIIIR